jgi:hypothetical protein
MVERICVIAALALTSCRASPTGGETTTGSNTRSSTVDRVAGPALPLARIAIVGASVSSGFGGAPFGEAFAAAAPRSKVDSAASTMLFRNPLGDIKRQLTQATEQDATTVVGVDLLFWCAYGWRDQPSRMHAIEVALGELERVRATGAWIILGDVPLITTASELMLPKESIPDPTSLGVVNEVIRAWSSRERVLLIPLVEWTDPLRTDADVEIAPGEKVPARSLMALDGLHTNALGTWYLLDRLDHFIETRVPGTAKDALVFVRPRE